MTLFATAAFGLEGVVASELKRLGMREVRAELGGARFCGSMADAFFCNLRLRRAGDGRSRLMTLLFLAVLLTGILQYPLPFLGNGYADTNKQLYLFMLCHDVCMLWAACFLVIRAAQGFRHGFVTK